MTSRRPLTTSAKWRWTDATVTCRCAAGRMATIRRRTAWRKSRPTAATSPCNRPTTGTCTGPRPGSTAGCSAPNGSWRKSNWRWSTWRSAARRRPASSSGCGPTSCGCSSRASARRFSPGPSRNWRTASGATANWPRYAFPTPEFRHGQRQLAEAVYKAASAGCCLMAQAPTGIGKTIGTLFPQLKAMPGQRLDRLFFLAAKTPGRAPALHALRSLEGRPADCRCGCWNWWRGTRPASTRTRPATASPVPGPGLLRTPAGGPRRRRGGALAGPGAVARGGAGAPGLSHYLGQELARWCDLAVGDYNYYFDLGAMLHGLAQVNQWRVAVLVDGRTTWWSAAGGCIPPNSTRAISSVCAKPPRRP